MLYNNIVVVDFETTSLDREACEVWQIGAVALRPRDLQLYDTQFNVMMRVDEPDRANPASLAVSGMTIGRIMEDGVDPGEGWHAFASWCSQFNLGGKSDLYNAPVMGGHNILNFDRFICDRYCFKYKTLKRDKKLDRDVPGIFHSARHYDTIQLLTYWTENLKEPKSLGLVNLRKYMSMSQESIDNAHDALQDVRDTAAILRKLLGLARTIAPHVKFKDAFSRESPPIPQKEYSKSARKRKVEKNRA